MIRYSDTSLIKDLPNNAVLIHPVNCEAKINYGIMQAISRQIPDWYTDFRRYCFWFMDGHAKEIIGTFHRFELSPTKLICSCFVQERAIKGIDFTDYEAWTKVLNKIELQTRRINATGKSWTLHFDSRFYTTKFGEDEEFTTILHEIFDESPVELVIHTGR